MTSEDWRYSEERMDVRTQGLNILLKKFGSELCSDGSPRYSTQSIYECIHDWVSQGNKRTMGIRLPEPKNGAGLIPFGLSLLFGVSIIVLGYYHNDMHLMTVLKNAGFIK